MGLITAAHYRQRAGLNAGDQRIDEANACFASVPAEFACDIRGRGGIVDQNCPMDHAR